MDIGGQRTMFRVIFARKVRKRDQCNSYGKVPSYECSRCKGRVSDKYGNIPQHCEWCGQKLKM